MVAKLEWTQSNPQQNKEQLQNPTMGVRTNNEQHQNQTRFQPGLTQSNCLDISNFQIIDLQRSLKVEGL